MKKKNQKQFDFSDQELLASQFDMQLLIKIKVSLTARIH